MALLAQLKLLGLNALVLAVIAVHILYVNYLVRFRSGLDRNDQLRRYWADPQAVIFRPLFLPGLLSFLVATGINTMVRSIIFGLLRLMDAIGSSHEPVAMVGDLAVGVVATVAGALAGTGAYITFGGQLFWISVAGQCVGALLFNLIRVVQDGTAFLIALWAGVLVVSQVVASWWISRLVVSKIRQANVRDIQQVQAPKSPKSEIFKGVVTGGAMMLVTPALTVVRQLLLKYIYHNQYEDQYLATVLHSLADLMVLVTLSSVCISILSVVIAQGKPIPNWQWYCGYIFPNGAWLLSTGVQWLLPFSEPEKGWAASVPFFRLFFKFSAVGFLSGVVYLAVVAREASVALNPIEESELIVEDDDDDFE